MQHSLSCNHFSMEVKEPQNWRNTTLVEGAATYLRDHVHPRPPANSAQARAETQRVKRARYRSKPCMTPPGQLANPRLLGGFCYDARDYQWVVASRQNNTTIGVSGKPIKRRFKICAATAWWRYTYPHNFIRRRSELPVGPFLENQGL
jgi:hypothetical protein